MDRIDRDKEFQKTLNRIKPLEPETSTKGLYRVFAIAIFILVVTSFMAFFIANAPRGKIIAPKNGGQTPRLVEIKGFTSNLPQERCFIWVTVDAPDLKLSQPKRPIHLLNQEFTTKFYENGPNKTITVSLYAVNRDYNKQILKWSDEVKASGKEGGMAMLPEEFRLDSMVLTLKDR